MAEQRETPVALQTDTISNLPGAGVRTIIATVPVNGVPTPVQMQVISIADGLGNVIDQFADYNMNLAIIAELRGIRVLLAASLNIPAIFPALPGLDLSESVSPV